MMKRLFDPLRPMAPKKVAIDNDTYYIFNDDILFPAENPSVLEKEIAEMYLSLLNTSLEDQEEIVFTFKPKDLFHFLIHLQRNIKEKKE